MRKKKMIKIGSKIIVVLLVFIIFTLNLFPYMETVSSKDFAGSAEWMKTLDDDTLLSDLTIPGTHNSATKYIELPFFSRCQANTVGKQLKDGYRYLDMRLSIEGHRLKLMHSFTNAKTGMFPWSRDLYLDEVLEVCYQFLDEHPTETILFSVRKEYGEETLEDFQKLLNTYILENQNQWYLNQAIPTLGESRGKIVLLRRYEDRANLGIDAGIPLDWLDQVGVTTFENHTLLVQDKYELDTNEKWEAFEDFLYMCEKEYQEEVVINFLSTKGSFVYGHPYYFAKRLNHQLLETTLQAKTKYGWLIVDFGNANLARHIYSTNF